MVVVRVIVLLVVAGCRLGFDSSRADALLDTRPTDTAIGADAQTSDANNDACPGAVVLALGIPTMGTTCAADDSIAVSCSSGGADVFFTFDLPAMSTVRLSLTAGFIALAATGTCTSFAPACYSSADAFSNTTSAAQTWIVAVERSGGNCGAFNIQVQ